MTPTEELIKTVEDVIKELKDAEREASTLARGRITASRNWLEDGLRHYRESDSSMRTAQIYY